VSENEELLREALGSTQRATSYKSKKSPRGLKLHGADSTRIVDYDEIKITHARRSRRPDNQIETWTGYDFAHFLREKYIDKQGEDWNLNLFPACTESLRAKDALSNVFGFCDNFMFKDYIDFFFRNYFDALIKKNKGQFYISYLMQDRILRYFAKSYDYAARVKEVYSTQMPVDAKEQDLSNATIERSFLLSDYVFMSNCGVIVAINWLILQKKFDEVKALAYVRKACIRLKKMQKLDEVIKTTEKLSPYPDWMFFQDAKKIDEDLIVSIEFRKTKNSVFEFLRIDNNG